VNKYGKGRSLYISAAVDGEYSTQRGMGEHRNLIRNAIRHLMPKRHVSIQAPLNVEIVVLQDEKKDETIVHMVGFWPRKNIKNSWHRSPTSECMEEPALYRAVISTDRSIRQARALSKDTKVESDNSTVKIETQQVHEAIILKF
jgi:hypothetical protein